MYNLFKFVTLGLTPDKNILRNWNKRKKTFGTQNLGKDHIGTATALYHTWLGIKDWTDYCGLEGERFHNAWGRKTYSLTDCSLLWHWVKSC